MYNTVLYIALVSFPYGMMLLTTLAANIEPLPDEIIVYIVVYILKTSNIVRQSYNCIFQPIRSLIYSNGYKLGVLWSQNITCTKMYPLQYCHTDFGAKQVPFRSNFIKYRVLSRQKKCKNSVSFITELYPTHLEKLYFCAADPSLEKSDSAFFFTSYFK